MHARAAGPTRPPSLPPSRASRRFRARLLLARTGGAGARARRPPATRGPCRARRGKGPARLLSGAPPHHGTSCAAAFPIIRRIGQATYGRQSSPPPCPTPQAPYSWRRWRPPRACRRPERPPSRGGGPSIPSQSRRAPASTAEAPSRRSPIKGAHSYAQPRKMPPSATRRSGSTPVTLPLPLCRASPTLWCIQDRPHRRAPGSRQARGRRTCPSAPISPARCGGASCGTSWPRESGAPWP